MYLVRCNMAREGGAPCMTSYPHKNPKHNGPCRFCCRDLIAAGKLTTLKTELTFAARSDNEA